MAQTKVIDLTIPGREHRDRFSHTIKKFLKRHFKKATTQETGNIREECYTTVFEGVKILFTKSKIHELVQDIAMKRFGTKDESATVSPLTSTSSINNLGDDKIAN